MPGGKIAVYTGMGDVKIELFEDIAPNHVKRIKDLANSGKYDNVVFHRVIDGFMAQTKLYHYQLLIMIKSKKMERNSKIKNQKL